MAAKLGSKLNKSESVQVRFDPILKMAVELAAAKERRTLSSFTEMAVDRAARETIVAKDEAGNPVSTLQVAHECWNAEPRIRLMLLSDNYPFLLTIRERKIVDVGWIINTIVEKSVNMPVVDGGGHLMFKSLLGIGTWDDFCQYGDDLISFDELYQRVLKHWESMVKSGMCSWNKSDEYIEEIRKREMNEATTPNPS